MSRSKQSAAWLKRQAADPFVKQAQQQGWRSRAVFKLEEIDRKHRLVKSGQTVVDLGAAPGGWSQYVAKKTEGNGRIIAIDLLPIEAIDDVEIVQGDFTEDAILDQLLNRLRDGEVPPPQSSPEGGGGEGNLDNSFAPPQSSPERGGGEGNLDNSFAPPQSSPESGRVSKDRLSGGQSQLGERPYMDVRPGVGSVDNGAPGMAATAVAECRLVDLVLSDMAPNMSGQVSVDIPRHYHLVELALDFAKQSLKPSGGFVVKLLQGDGFETFVQQCRSTFNRFTLEKPKASRRDSREVYGVGLGLKYP